MVKGNKYLTKQEAEALLNNNYLYALIWALLMRDQNINLKKVLILNYILKEKEVSINQIKKHFSYLSFDYKNIYRYIKQFQKSGILEKDKEVSQGKKSRIKIIGGVSKPKK